MGNGKGKPPQSNPNGLSASTQDALVKIEKEIDECRHDNEKRVLEAKVSVAESRVTYLLVILALLGIIFPFWMTNRNSDKVDEAIKDMKGQFRELAGEYLRKPDIVCEIDGAPLLGRSLVVGPNEESSQSFTVRNTGDASAGMAYVYLCLKDTPAGLGFLASSVRENPYGGAVMDPLPSSDMRFAVQYLVTRITAFHAKTTFSLRLWCSPDANATLDVEVPAMLKIYYDGPQPLEVPFTVKMVPAKR